MSSIATRASWGARNRNGVGNRPTGRLEKYLHHTVTAHLSESASVAQERAQMRIIEGIGQQRFGAGISYTFIIFPSGRIYEGASVHRISYHSGAGRNTRGAGICLAGNYDQFRLGTPGFNAIVALLQEGVRRGWWGDPALTSMHRDFRATSCPGRHAAARFADINRAGRSGTTAPTSPEAPKEPIMSASDIWNQREPAERTVQNRFPQIREDGYRMKTWVQYTWSWARRAVEDLPGIIWNRRIKPERSVTNRYSIREDGYRASTWVQYAYLQARWAREQAQENAVVLQAIAKSLKDVAEGNGDHIYDAVAEAIAEHDKRRVQIDVRIAEDEADDPDDPEAVAALAAADEEDEDD